MTVVCECCDRSFTYNNEPESEEKIATHTITDNKNNNAALIVRLSAILMANERVSEKKKVCVRERAFVGSQKKILTAYPFDRSIRFCDFCEYAAVL